MKVSLTPRQQEIVEHKDGALLVVAGPGSGKTRVLTERVRRLLVTSTEHFRVLALTFTNKAANEMKERLAEFKDIENRAFIGTLHSFCMEVLANRGKHLGIDGVPTIFERHHDRKQVLLQAVTEDPKLNSILKNLGDPREQARALDRWLEFIKESKNALIVPELVSDSTLQAVYESYNEGLSASKALDFDDLLILTYRLFVERPRIADFYRRQFPYICIDEAQDLNEAQYGVIKSLCGTEHKNLMMVGDPKQAIFVWNGANPKYLDLFEQDFNARKLELTENFRSARRIVEMAQALYPDYEVQGQLPIMGEARLVIGVNEEEEALKVLEIIDRLLENGHADVEGELTLARCALIGRNRYVLSSIEQKLIERGTPFYKQLSAQTESESALLKDFELGLRLIANPENKLHLQLLCNRWHITDDVNTSNLFEELEKYSNHSHSEIVINSLRPLQFGKKSGMLEALNTLESYADTHQSPDERALILEDIETWKKHWDFFLRSQRGGTDLNLSAFLSHVALGTTQSHRQDGLALLTIHSAKGLEFDAVFILGMAEGTFPDYRATGEALEEEQRNAFVAVTRSRRLLFLSYPRTKNMRWGETKSQQPSRYLKKLGLE